MAKRRTEADEQDAVATAPEPVEQERQYYQQETFASFQRRHGDYIEVGVEVVRIGGAEGYLLFEDGARALTKRHINFGGQEPPVGLLANGRARLEYANEKLRRETLNYDQFLARCREQANFHLRNPHSCPPPPPGWREQCDAGSKRIERWTKRVNELNEILNKLDPRRAAKLEMDAAEETNRAERQKILDELMAYGGGQVFSSSGAGPDPM
jgi:hypothetical protein